MGIGMRTSLPNGQAKDVLDWLGAIAGAADGPCRGSSPHTHARTRVSYTHACARTHARSHARTHSHTHTHTHAEALVGRQPRSPAISTPVPRHLPNASAWDSCFSMGMLDIIIMPLESSIILLNSTAITLRSEYIKSCFDAYFDSVKTTLRQRPHASASASGRARSNRRDVAARLRNGVCLHRFADYAVTRSRHIEGRLNTKFCKQQQPT